MIHMEFWSEKIISDLSDNFCISISAEAPQYLSVNITEI
jgi:hypothetical protein